MALIIRTVFSFASSTRFPHLLFCNSFPFLFFSSLPFFCLPLFRLFLKVCTLYRLQEEAYEFCKKKKEKKRNKTSLLYSFRRLNFFFLLLNWLCLNVIFFFKPWFKSTKIPFSPYSQLAYIVMDITFLFDEIWIKRNYICKTEIINIQFIQI